MSDKDDVQVSRVRIMTLPQWIFSILAVWSIVTLLGDPWLWEISDHQETQELIYAIGALIMLELLRLGDKLD